MLTAVGRVARDQAYVDEHQSLNQRVTLAGGSAVGGIGEATLGEELQPLIDALGITSMSTVMQAEFQVASFPGTGPRVHA